MQVVGWWLFLVGVQVCCGGVAGWGSRPRTVSVKCQEHLLVVTALKKLFGTERLIKASDLSLGQGVCPPTRVDNVLQSVVFEYGLHECGISARTTHDALVYTTYLNYVPRNTGIIMRTNAVTIPIVCHYPRKRNVSSNAIQPTWIPYNATKTMEQHLAFSLLLMNDDWSAERTSKVYYLGDFLHIEAAVESGSMPLRIYIDNCVATPSPDLATDIKYAVIDSNGCLLDSKAKDSSASFQIPRLQPNKLQLKLDAFRFHNDARNTIYLHCHLKVSTTDQAPNEFNKACSFEKTSEKWLPVEGAEDICSCCEGTCGFRAAEALRWRTVSIGSRWERNAVLGPLLVQDSVDEDPVMDYSFNGSQSMAGK